MEKIDLSTNARKIEDAYLKVVRNEGINYLVLTVDNSSIVEVSETGSGDLHEFIENFTDGHVQFGLARVNVPGSDVYKNLLLGWCPDNARAKSRLSFASNFADIANVLVGYHVQITARDVDDLDVDEFLQRVSAAAGARYSIQSVGQPAKPISKAIPKPIKPITPRPAVKPASDSSDETPVKPAATPAKPAAAPAKPAAKPSFIPKSTGNPIAVDTPIIKPKPAPTPAKAPAVSAADEDDWDEDEIEERDFSEKPLEDVPSAYKPTKVNIEELRKQKSDTISSQPKPVKQEEQEEDTTSLSLKDRMLAYKKNEEPSDGRLTSLPKPKTNHSVSSRFSPTPEAEGVKFGAVPGANKPADKSDKLVPGFNRDYASENGKTPAQIWAEKRGKYKTVPQSDEPVKELADEVEKVDIKEPSPEASPSPAPAPLPARNLPPPPVRQPEPEPEVEEEPEPEVEEKPEAEPEPEVEEEPETEPEAPAPPLAPRPAAVPPVEKKAPSAVAEYTYEKDEDNEIGFEEGDLIIEIDFVDDDWWSGKHSKSGEIGLFPSSYVVLQELDSSSAPTATESPAPAASEPPAPALPTRTAVVAEPESSKPSAVAEFTYEKDEDNEIGFEEGDEIVEIEFVDDDWWSGKHTKSGEVGLFPSNYVKLT